MTFAANASALVVLAAAAGLSALLGFVAAYDTDARPRRARHAHARSARRPKRTHSTRFDEVGSAILHFGVVGLLIGGELVGGHVTTAVAFMLFYIGVAWGPIAVHEFGHAFAAAHTVTHVRIGIGLELFRSERLTVGAIPASGITRWAPNPDTMTGPRELAIVLAGPTANLLVAAALLAVPAVRHDGYGVIIIGAHALMGLVNLVPVDREVGGRRMFSDGARALRLLRPSRVRAA